MQSGALAHSFELLLNKRRALAPNASELEQTSRRAGPATRLLALPTHGGGGDDGRWLAGQKFRLASWLGRQIVRQAAGMLSWREILETREPRRDSRRFAARRTGPAECELAARLSAAQPLESRRALGRWKSQEQRGLRLRRMGRLTRALRRERLERSRSQFNCLWPQSEASGGGGGGGISLAGGAPERPADIRSLPKRWFWSGLAIESDLLHGPRTAFCDDHSRECNGGRRLLA